MEEEDGFQRELHRRIVSYRKNHQALGQGLREEYRCGFEPTDQSSSFDLRSAVTTRDNHFLPVK